MPKLKVKCYVSLTWRCSIPFEESRIINAFAQHLYIFVLSILCECVVVSNVGVGRNSRILTKCIQIKQNAKECKAITTFNVNSIWVSHKWFPFAKMVSTLKSNLTLPFQQLIYSIPYMIYQIYLSINVCIENSKCS